LFLLEDDTGTCVIDPDDAEVTPSISETWYGTRATRSLDTFNVYPRIRVLSKILARTCARYRYTELRLTIDESLYAIGEFKSVGVDYRKEVDQSVHDFLNKLKRDKNKLAEYDANQDGTIDQEEWEVARKDAHHAALQKQLSNPLPKSTHLLRKPESKLQQPFLLSAKSESHLARNSRIFSYVLATAFIVLIVGIFFKLVAYI